MDVAPDGVVAHNVKRIGHIDIPGGGQVVTQGNLAFIGHMDPPHGTSIIDISDLTAPRVISTLGMPPGNHSHKVRVAGDVMVINNENAKRHQMAAAARIPAERERLEAALGR
ncbi:MAG: RNA polymerase subunit sigma-70, partial [Alphaproteobacteria bacterium]